MSFECCCFPLTSQPSTFFQHAEQISVILIYVSKKSVHLVVLAVCQETFGHVTLGGKRTRDLEKPYKFSSVPDCGQHHSRLQQRQGKTTDFIFVADNTRITNTFSLCKICHILQQKCSQR